MRNTNERSTRHHRALIQWLPRGMVGRVRFPRSVPESGRRLSSPSGRGWWLTDSLDEWAPNAAVEALSISATIVIVERIVRHEARERLRPRVESAMNGLRGEFRKFVHGVAWDYAGTHLRSFRGLRSRDSRTE